MDGGNWVEEEMGEGNGGCSGSGMRTDRRKGQKARRMNGNLQLSRVGASLGRARDLEWRRLSRVYGDDLS